MSQRSLYVRVGAMLFGSVALLVVLILALTGDRWHTGHKYETYFKESVQGLDVGAPVKFRGVTLGRIDSIRLVAADYGGTEEEQVMDPTYRLVVVRFTVDPSKVGRLPKATEAVQGGLRAKLANQGLTGVMYLELDFLQPDKFPVQTVPWTPKEDYIPSVPSTFVQVQDSVTQLLQRLNAIDFPGVMKNVQGLVSDLRTSIGAGGAVNGAVAAAKTTIDDIRAQIDAADLAGLSAQLKQTGAAISSLSDGKQTRAVLARAQESLAKLPPLIDSLQQTAGRANGGVNDLQAQLIPILEGVRVAVENVREITEALRRDPGALLGDPPPGGVKKQ
jgi:ABC-type transporter Mla subunit MlaD